MHGIPFIKYTSFGNNFVIVDETLGQILSEKEKMEFAYQATNGNFGVGSDNFLVIQPCTKEILQQINHAHHYWEKEPDAAGSDYIFRMFEPDGAEAFSCGNGLMCIANYLYRQYGIKSTRIMTEIPTATPKVISIGTEPARGISWANMGHPQRMPEDLVDRSITVPFDKEIDMIRKIEITNFRDSDAARFFSNEKSLTLTGYLVFTGEPHFVVFTEDGFSLDEPAHNIFPSGRGRKDADEREEKRMSTGSSLVRFIGKYFERVYPKIFPAGININFVRCVKKPGTLEYRCFERGINRETLACGTGALATAFVARRLNIVESDRISVLPHRCRWHDENAEIQVAAGDEGWLIHGRPMMLFEGMFALNKPLSDEKESMASIGVQVTGDIRRYESVLYN